MNADALVEIDTRDAIVDTVLKYRKFIRYAAVMLAREELDLVDDLEQEAFILLWEIDPSRFDDEDGGYLLRAIFKRMQFRYRTHRRAEGGSRRVESLEHSSHICRSEVDNEY